jgi:hypothetical protein
MAKFLDAFALTKLNQDDISHLNISIMTNKIEVVIMNFPTKKSPGSDGFTSEVSTDL